MSWIKKKLLMREQLKDLSKIKVFLEAHLQEWVNRKKDIQADIYDATRYILETLIESYDAIHTLYGKEHIESCIILARTILENGVNLKYIHYDEAKSEQRARNFILYPMKPWLERSKGFTEEELAGKEDLFAGIRKQLEKYKPAGNNKNHWDGRTIKDLFEEVRLISFYTEGYSRLSGFTHPQYKTGIDMHTERPYYNFIRKFIFQDILLVSLESLKMINERYDLLEGAMIIKDYPKKGIMFVFSVNNKKYDSDGKPTTQIP